MGQRISTPAAAPAAPKPATGAGQAPAAAPSAAADAAGRINAANPPAPNAAPPAGAASPPAGTAAAPEAAPPSEPTPGDVNPENDPKFAPKFAALAKRERALLEREQRLKATEAEIADYRKARDNAKLDPISLLKAHGWEYDGLTQFVINDGKLTDAQRLKMLEAEKAANEQKAAEDAKKDLERKRTEAVENHLGLIKKLVDERADDFELIRLNDAHDLVYEVQLDWFHKTKDAQGQGQVMPIEEACKKVEEYFEGQSAKLKDAKKASKLFGTALPASEGSPASEGTQTPPETSPTMTNRIHATATPTPPQQSRWLSDEESKANAAKLLKWK